MVQELAPELPEFSSKTWFGARYYIVNGRPKFETMCREFPIKDNLGANFLESNFESGFTTPWDPIYHIEEPMIGIDGQLGYQMLQHSLEQGMKEGYIFGTPFVSSSGLSMTGKPIPARAEPVGESGGKIRWITIEPAWTNLLLQPLGHELINLLAKDPHLKSGFQRSWKGYDFANDLAMSDLSEIGDHYVVQGDLEVATDNMTFDYVATTLLGFLKGSGRFTPFLRLLVELLCYPREIWRNGKPVFVTKSGILMGCPGTKPALAIMGKAARALAYYRYNFEKIPLRNLFKRKHPKQIWDVYRSAGDDFIDIGPLKYLELLRDCHILLGHRVGTFIYSRRVSRYCEEPLIFVNKIISHKVPLYKVTDYQTTIHVDSLKVRVFSPCGKVSSGPNEDFKNPVIGKGQAFERKLPWLPGDWLHLRKQFTLRWCFRMKDYIDLTEPYWFLPQNLGGVGLPNPYKWDDVIYGILKRCPSYLAVSKAVLDGTAPFWLHKVIQSMSAGGISRGSDLDLRQAAHEGYVMSAEISGHQKSQEDIAEIAGIKSQDFNNLSRGKRRDIAKQYGFIAEFDLDTIVEKAWLIKSAFQLAYYGDECDNGPKERLSPEKVWNQLSELINSSESRVLPTYDMKEEILKLFHHLVTSQRPKEAKHVFINESIVSRNFGALKTPLPATTSDFSVVRGSTRDL
jgi:hypothetical protein